MSSIILRLHYVPGGPGSPVCSKRTCSVPWNFGHTFLCFQDLLYCVYTMLPAAPAAPFARNVACRGVLVIHFSDFQDLLRFVTFSYMYVVLRYS